MATDLYRVDSYHFNVGQGDGAIHILCKLVTGKKPTVERAVLCDGGDGGKHLTNLQKFIYTDYAVIYDIPTKGVPLKFDSIIITHWDDDHCNGIVDLIKKDWEAFFNTKRKPINDKAVAPGPVDTVTEDISQAYNPAFKELPTDTDAEKEQKTGLKKQAMKWLGQIDYYLQEWQCGFLKYDAGACTTHLYAPDWADSEGQDKTVYLNRFEPKKHYLYPPGTDAVDPNYDDKIKRLKTDGTTTPPRRSWSRSNQLVEGVKGTDGTWMNVLLKTTIKGPPRAKMPFTTSKDSHWDLPVYTYKKKFCKLRYTVGECIGVDFFTNESLPSATPYTAVADVTQLIDAHKANASTYPVGCYCLGQGRYAIGVADNIDEVMDAFPDGWRGLDGGDERVIDEKNDKRNWQSTVAIVLWKDTKRVSHYFAGDADFEKELFATKWVLGDGSTKRDGEPLVPCMKISHHGSHSSTPIPILRTFQPHYLIASLGDSNTYFHPRWQVIFYIWAWLLEEGRTGRGQRVLFTTEFPNFLVTEKHTGGVAPVFPHVNLYQAYLAKQRNSLPGVAKYTCLEHTVTEKAELSFKKRLSDTFVEINKGGRNPPMQDIFVQFDAFCTNAGIVLDEDLKESDPGLFYAQQYNVATWINYMCTQMWPKIADLHTTPARKISPLALKYVVVRSQDGGATYEVKVRPQTGSEGLYNPPTFTAFVNTPGAILPAEPEIQTTKDTAGIFLLPMVAKPVTPVATTPVATTPTSGTRAIASGDADVSALSLRDGGADDDDLVMLRDASDTPGAPPAPVDIVDNDVTTPLGQFLDQLRGKKIAVDKALPADGIVQVISTDPLFAWLQQTLALTSLAVHTNAAKEPDGFTLTLDAATTFGQAAVKTLSFSTSSLTSACLGQTDKAGLPLGVHPGTGTIGFGLDPGTDLTSDIITVLKWTGFTDVGKNPFVAYLGEQVKLTLKGTAEALKGARNVIWFNAASASTTVTRLQWAITAVPDAGGIVAKVTKTLGDFLKDAFEITNVTLITRRTNATATGTGGAAGFSTSGEVLLEVALKIVGKAFLATLKFTDDALDVKITTEEEVFEQLFSWLAKSTGDIPVVGWITSANAFQNVMKNIHLREISLSASMAAGKRQITEYGLKLEIGLSVGADDDNPAPILMTYTGTPEEKSSKLRGELWIPSDIGGGQDPLFIPDFEPTQTLFPRSGHATTIDLAKLQPKDAEHPDGGVKNIPEGIPTVIEDTYIEINYKALTLNGKISCEPSTKRHNVPQIALDVVTLNAVWTFKPDKPDDDSESSDDADGNAPKALDAPDAPETSDDTPALRAGDEEGDTIPDASDGSDTSGDDSEDTPGLKLSLGVKVKISPPDGSAYPDPAYITGSLLYDKGDWTLKAQTTPLNGSALYSFFDPSAKDGTFTMLEKLYISGLELEYKYSKGVGSSFSFKGAVGLGKLELALTYDYKPEEWSFKAQLGSTEETSTINEIIKDITGDDKDPVPGFVGDIKIGKGQKSALTLLCTKKSKKKEKASAGAAAITEAGEGGDGKDVAATEEDPANNFLFFSLTINVGLGDFPLRGTFLQYRELTWDKSVTPKRALKFALMGLPAVNIPAVGNLTQPFDEAFFMWVSANKAGEDSDKKTNGFSAAEVTNINAALLGGKSDEAADELIYKEKSKSPKAKAPAAAKGTPPEAVILPGFHFVLVLKLQGKRSVLLDYVFGQKKDKKSDSSRIKPVDGADEASAGTLRAAEAEADTPAAGDEPATVPYKKQAGPITIDNIGFEFKDDTLSILLDAAFVLGPLGFQLIGFKIILNFEKGKTFRELPDIDFGLDGLSVAFNKPPLTIAGGFIHYRAEDLEFYAGGVTLAFVPYLFKAAGFYGKSKANGEEFTSVFVFAKLEGPLATIGYAEISGVTAGFGYNMSMRFPTAENVPSFPLLSSGNLGAGDMSKTLSTLVATKPGPSEAWFAIKKDSFWLAAGLKVKAFEILSIDAVIAVEWDPDVKLGLFGICVADFPKGAPMSHIEIGISAVIDLGQGVMKLEAQLTPNSYLFSEMCKLTGGFALYAWFPARHSNKALDGDWVFTVGGYHRAYKRPAHYPNPPRLGISWQVGSAIKITGEAYFAITPVCCMAGGRLVATLQLGPLKAWFEAYADFLIKYKPFYFQADGGISVGVSCKVDLLICSFTVSIELSARLHLEGPPLCGRVHVDFWVMAFDVDFGPRAVGAPPVSLVEFYKLVKQADQLPPAADPAAAAYELVDPEAHLLVCTSGLVSESGKETDTPPGDPWRVRGGIFAFEIKTRVALSRAQRTITEVTDPDPEHPKEKPALDDVVSPYDVYGRPMRLTGKIASGLSVKIKLLKDDGNSRDAAPEEDDIPEGLWNITPVHVASPSALWGQYNSGTDPSASGGNNSPDLLSPKDATIPQMMGIELSSPEPHIAPDKIPKFSAIDAMSENVSEQSFEPIFKPHGPSVPAFAHNDLTVAQRWDEVPKQWQDTRAKQAKMARFFAKTVGWGEDSVKDVQTPDMLWSKFKVLYMAPPMVSVA